MNEILSDRKNKGNVTYRIVLSENSGRIFINLEKLMKVRSKEADKKTTKKIVTQKTFFMDDFDKIKNEIDDEMLLQLCIDTMIKVQNHD